MRKIQTQDVFKLARILKAGNLKAEITEAMSGDKGSAEIGLGALMAIMESVSDEKVEKMIYELLGSIMEEKADYVKGMPINELSEAIKQMSEENDLKSFFQIASKSI